MMSNLYGGPWSNQPEGAGPGQQSGWAQPGPSAPAAAAGPYDSNQPGYAPQPGYPPGPSGYSPAVGSPADYAMPLRTDYASWGKRVVALLIDEFPTYIGMIVFFVGYGYWIASIAQSSGSRIDLSGGAVPMMIGTVIMLAGFGWNIYNRWLVAGRTGQSLGKRVIRIRLIGETTEAPIGPMNAFLRDIMHVLDRFGCIGYLWPLWDDKRQTFADKIMRTI